MAITMPECLRTIGSIPEGSLGMIQLGVQD
jgi:hypothetical protein